MAFTMRQRWLDPGRMRITGRSRPFTSRSAVLVDVRSPGDFAQGHLPGAVHLDLWGVSLIVFTGVRLIPVALELGNW